MKTSTRVEHDIQELLSFGIRIVLHVSPAGDVGADMMQGLQDEFLKSSDNPGIKKLEF